MAKEIAMQATPRYPGVPVEETTGGARGFMNTAASLVASAVRHREDGR